MVFESTLKVPWIFPDPKLHSRVLGHLIQEGTVAKIADDFYVGGNSGKELLTNWVKVLEL